MARSFVYKRPLDAKTLSDTKNSDHVFRFNTLLDIKKEVEDDSLDMETELSAGASPATSTGLFDNHHSVLQSGNISEHQCNEGNEASHPKLVLKFRDLLNKTEHRVESTKKRKRNKEKEPKNRILTMPRLRSNKRPRSEICVSSETRMTRSLMLMQTSSDSNKGRRSTSNSVQQQAASDKEEQQDTWSMGRITRLRKTLNICEICGICFQSKRQLRAHESYYTGDGEFHCTICDIKYNRSWQLSRHDRVAHSKEDNGGIYEFKCTVCTDRFDKKASLIAHVTHLHKIHVVPYKKSVSSNKELVSLHDISTRNTRKKTRKLKSVQKLVEPINAEDHVISFDVNADTTEDSNKLVRNLDNKEALLVHKISRVQQNNERQCNQLTDDNIHPNNKKVNAGSTQHPANTTYAKHGTPSTPQTSVVSEAEAQEKSEDAQKKMTEDLSPKTRFSKGNGAVRRSTEHNKVRRQMQRRSQAGSEVLSKNVEPQLGGDLVDNLGNKVGNWRVTGPINQPDETGNRPGCTGGSPTIDTADKSLEITMVNRIRRTRSSTLIMTRLLNSAQTTTNIVTHSDQQSLQNEEPSTQEESTNGAREKGIIGKVCLDPENVDEKLLPQYQHLDEQVGSVSSHQISGDLRATSRNVTRGKDSDGAVVKCNNVDIDSIQVDNFVDTHASAIVKCENEEMSDGSCESIALKMTASSSNVSLTNSLSFESHDEITLTRCDTPNDLKIKDVRVLLVRLENMLDLPMQNTTPKLSLLENCSIVKTEQPDYNPCDKQSVGELVLRQHSRRNHNFGEVGTNNESKSKPRKKRVSHNYHSNVIPIHNRLQPNRKLRHGLGTVTQIRCYLCDEVFRSKFLAASHYLSVHTEVGVLQCCLCFANFKSSRKLRIHLCGNCKIFYKQKCIKSCVVCKKRLRLPNLSQRCSECNRNSESEKCDSRAEQFPKVQDSTEHRSAHALASDKMNAVENKTVSLFVIPPVTISRGGTKTNTTKIDHESAKNDNKVISHKNCKNNHQFKSKYINRHDRLCKKKLQMQRRFRFSPIGSMSQHSLRLHRIRGVSKIRYGYKCDVCGLSCCCRRSSKIHKTRYSTNGNNVCNICGLTFAWKYVLVIHMKTAHNPKNLFHGKYKCEICHQAFYNTKFLRIHLAHFHNIKYFQCKICRVRFDTCRSLNNHVRYYSTNLNCLCGTCGQSFRCKYMLEYHKHRVHNHEKLKMYKYFCDVCNCAFIDELLLHAHISHFHNRQDCEVEGIRINKEIQVRTTEQLPEDLENTKVENVCINSNVETHNSIIEKQANEVHRSRVIPEDVVDETIRTHTSSEYKCGICKLSFNKPYDILNHEWEFSNDGIYACNVCNRKFITNILLKTHKLKHYQRNVIREHECYVCREDFPRLDDLKMHGLHLHGPKFVWEKGVETADKYNENILDSRIKCYSNDVLKKLSIDGAYDTIGLMASDEVAESEKILFFQKITNHRSTAELLRRHSNEDAYCCHFCDLNFSSVALLEDHIKKHYYRAYYTNSARYLCLICKNKFRTNDVLRAHVIYCHTSDKMDQTLSEPECLGDSIPNQLIQPITELIQPQPHSNNEQPSINRDDNSADISSINLHPKQRNAKQPSSSRKCMSIRQSKSASPRKENQSSNSANDVDKCKKDHGICNSVPSEVRCKIMNPLKCQDSGNADDGNRSGLKSSESQNIMTSDLTMEEVEFFTIKLEDGKGLEKHTCIICLEIFQSVPHFRKHFASVHVKNGSYLCNLCGGEFLIMSDLKYHTIKHKQEPKNYVCCDSKFQLTDFVRHKLSHVEQIDSRRMESNTQSLALVGGGALEKSNGEPNVTKMGNPCKCEVCDEAFMDFETMLKHWDSCIDTNGLQCHLCRARFKSRKWLQVHKMSHHEKKENCTTVQNRSTFRENCEETMQISTHRSTVHHNECGGGRTINNSVNRNATQRQEATLTSTDHISREDKLLKVGTITVKRLAQMLPNLKNNGSRVNSEAKDMSPTVNSRPKFLSKQSREIPKQRGIAKKVKTKVQIEKEGKKNPLERKSISQVSKSNEQVPNGIPCNSNGNSLSCHLPVQDSNNLDKHLVPNDFSLSFQQNEYKEQRLSILQPASPSTAVNSSSIQSMAYNCVNLNDTRVASISSGQKSDTNDRGDKRTINLLPPSSNITGSPAYYLCIPPAVNSYDNINNAMVVASDLSNKSQPNDRSDKILSSLVPVTLNSAMSPTYYLCVQRTTDDSSTIINQKVLPGNSNLKSHSNNCIDKSLPTLIAKRPNIILNSGRTSDIPQIPHNSNNNSSQNVSNDVSSRTYSNRTKVRKVPIILATTATLTGSAVSTLHKQTTSAAENTPINISASTTEAILRKQIVRCSYCSQLFTEKTKLIDHMASHRTDNQCPACGLKFSNERALQQHLPEHKCSKCTRCNRIFFFSDSTAYPTGVHKFCSVCNSLLPLPTRRLSRFIKNSVPQVMKCGICMDTFGTISEMSVHFKLIHSSFVCGICGSRFSTKTSLDSHMQTHGSDTLDTSQCTICKKYFMNKSNLAAHALSHEIAQAIK